MRVEPTLTESQLRLLGLIVSHFAYVDFFLAELIRGILGLSEGDGDILFRSASVRQKTEWLERLVGRIQDESIRASLAEVVAAVPELAAGRDLLAHGIVAHPGPSLERPIVVALKGRYKRDPPAISDELLSKLLSDIRRASETLLGAILGLGFLKAEPMEPRA